MDFCINANAMFLAQSWSDVITDDNCLLTTKVRWLSDKVDSNDPLITLIMRALYLLFKHSKLLTPS